MGFRFVPKSVTLNDLERSSGRLAINRFSREKCYKLLYTPCSLRYFTDFACFWAYYYVKVVEDTLIHSTSEM